MKETILVVDDSKIIRKMVKNYLKDMNHTNVISCKDGKDALHKIKILDEIDLLIVDWELGDVSGIKIIKAINNLYKNSNLKTLMITSRRAKRDVINALKAGATDFLSKPFDYAAFEKKINKLI